MQKPKGRRADVFEEKWYSWGRSVYMEMEVKEVSGECMGSEGMEQVLWTLMKDFGYYLVNWFLDNFIGSYAY